MTGNTRFIGGIIPKRTLTPGKIPTGTTGNDINLLMIGEIASNLADKTLWGFDGLNVFEYGSNSFLYLTGGSISGDVNISGALSANTFYSAGTPLETIIRSLIVSDTHTFVQPGTNIITGGTALLPVVNLSNDISLNSVDATIISGGTFISGGTDLGFLISQRTLQADFDSHTGDTNNPHSVTASQIGVYTTGQTDNLLDTKANISGDTFTGTIIAPSFSASSVSADTFYLGGELFEDKYTTAATLSSNILFFDRTDQLSAFTVDLSSLVVSGASDSYTTASTLVGDVVYFDRNDQASAYTLSLSGFITTDTYVTGGTYDVNTSTLSLDRNDGATMDFTGMTDYYTTAVTLNGNVLSFDRQDQLSAYTVDLSSLVVSAATDSYTTASTLVGTTVFFDRNDQLSAYTLDLSSLVVSGASDTYVTGGTYDVNTSTLSLDRNDGATINYTGLTDYYTTAATLVGNVLYFDRQDQLSAYSIDLSSIVVSGGTGGGSGGTIYSASEPSVSLYSGNTWVRTTDNNFFVYSDDLGEWIGSNIIKFSGARNKANQNNIFLRHLDGTTYNLNPYRVYSDTIISNVVASGRDLDSWDAHILTGTSIATDSIYSLNLSSQRVNYDDSVNLYVASGTSLYLYMSGTSVSYPSIDVYLKNK